MSNLDQGARSILPAATCETCKHWGRDDDDYLQEVGIKQCVVVPMLWDSYEWSKDRDHRVLKAECAGNLAFVKDGSDYYASLFTRPNFACNQHEPLAAKEQG